MLQWPTVERQGLWWSIAQWTRWAKENSCGHLEWSIACWLRIVLTKRAVFESSWWRRALLMQKYQLLDRFHSQSISPVARASDRAVWWSFRCTLRFIRDWKHPLWWWSMWYSRYSAWTTAEVAQFILSLCIDEYVFHLYISMTDSFRMHMLKYACHSYQYLDYHFFVELYALALLEYIEGSPFYQYWYPLLQFSMNKRPYFSSLSAISPQSNSFTTLGCAKSWSIYLDGCGGTFIYCMRWRFLH